MIVTATEFHNNIGKYLALSEKEEEGMDALIASLGYVDAERFVMLMNKETFDYTKWRETHLDDGLTVRELSKKASQLKVES